MCQKCIHLELAYKFEYNKLQTHTEFEWDIKMLSFNFHPQQEVEILNIICKPHYL